MHRPSNRGFTLIELMLVIAIAGILALVTLPKFGAVKEHYRLQTSADAVVVRLSHAKQLAMDRRENVYVRLSSNSVEVVDKNGNSLGESARFENGVAFDPSQSVALGLKISNSNAPLTVGLYYDYRGFIRAGGVVGDTRYAAAVELRGSSGTTIRINIEAGTGYVTISR